MYLDDVPGIAKAVAGGGKELQDLRKFTLTAEARQKIAQNIMDFTKALSMTEQDILVVRGLISVRMGIAIK